MLLILIPSSGHALNLTGFWASDGGHKVARQDFYPHGRSTETITRNWDGTTAKTFGFRNEAVSLVLYMKAGASDATNVSVQVSSLTGPSGAGIVSVPVSSTSVFDWTTRPIEVFYVRYFKIGGLSQLGADPSEYEARHYPVPFRRPCTVDVNDDCVPNGGTLWTDRPDHDKYYPDILVPYEAIAASSFTVSASSSQAIWIDYYIAAGKTVGTYTGTITVQEGVSVSTTIPVQLIVKNGTLPDVGTMKSIGVISLGNVSFRHHGDRFPASQNVEPYYTTQKRYKQMLHRHKIATIGDDNLASDAPHAIDLARLNGTLFSAATGYGNAPGIDTGEKVYSIGTYGGWQSSWDAGASTNSATLFCAHVSNWQQYFIDNSLTDVRSFVYLADETLQSGFVEKWANWMSTVTTCQNASYKTWPWVTSNWTTVKTDAPHVGMPAATSWMGVSSATWDTSADYYLTTASSQAWNYNASSPWTAMLFNHEEEGWGPREIAWGNFKKGASRMSHAIPHFLWETTYFKDSNDSGDETDLWNVAKTFGYFTSTDTVKGWTGFQFNNGDGVLMYPGTDLSYPANNYNLDGPFASWRLKMYRRGIQDADYMAQAYAINPTATMAIVNSIATTVLWEKNCFTIADCSYTYGERGFSQDAGAYETARELLAQTITDGAVESTTKSVRGSGTFRGGGTIR